MKFLITLHRIFEFFFDRWTCEVIEEGDEVWIRSDALGVIKGSDFTRSFVKYRLTNKFDGSQKIKIKYFN